MLTCPGMLKIENCHQKRPTKLITMLLSGGNSKQIHVHRLGTLSASTTAVRKSGYLYIYAMFTHSEDGQLLEKPQFLVQSANQYDWQ